MESVGTTTKAVITIATMIANMIIGTRAVTIMTMPTVAAQGYLFVLFLSFSGQLKIRS